MSKGAKLLLVLSVVIFVAIIFAVNAVIRNYEKETTAAVPAQTIIRQEPIIEPPVSRQQEAGTHQEEEGVEKVSSIDASQPLLQ